MQGTLTSGSVELSTELRAPTVRARPTDDYLTLTGGTQGTYLNSVLYTASAIRADNGVVSSPAYLELIGGSTGVQAQGDLQVVSTVNSGDVTAEVLNLATAGNARLLVACNAGCGELSASSAGGVQLYAQDQAIFLRTAATGPANLIVESNTGGANDGEVICNGREAEAQRGARGARGAAAALRLRGAQVVPADRGQPEAHAGLYCE